jgi:hypothetical protein
MLKCLFCLREFDHRPVYHKCRAGLNGTGEIVDVRDFDFKMPAESVNRADRLDSGMPSREETMTQRGIAR